MDRELYKAAISGDVRLLKEVADANKEALHSKSPQEDTALHIAARLGHAGFIDEILHRHPQGPQLLRMQNSQGDTALHQALRNSRKNVAIRLLRSDPELVFINNNAQESPLHLAVKEELQPVVEEMLGASLPNGSGATAINYSEDRKRELVAMKDSTGRSALHYAAWRDSAATVDMILRIDRRIVPYATDEGGFSPLHVAAAFGSQESISQLLEHCPDAIEQLDPNGRNALHIAVLNREVKSVCGLLTTCNAELMLNQEDKDGVTPERLAVLDEDDGTPKPFSFLYQQARDRSAILTLMDKARQASLNSSPLGKFLIEALTSDPRPEGQPRIMRAVIPEDRIKKHDGGQQQKKAKDTENPIMVIAALVATVTFAAGITVPGGLKSSNEANPGTAVLTDQLAFQAFMVSDTIAMCFSVSAMVVFFFRGLSFGAHFSQRLGCFLTLMASELMFFVFGTGVYVVISPRCKWLAVLVVLICVLTYGLVFVGGTILVNWCFLLLRNPQNRVASFCYDVLNIVVQQPQDRDRR